MPSIIHSKYGNYECRLDWSASISTDSHQCSLCQNDEEREFFECNLPNFTLAHDTQGTTVLFSRNGLKRLFSEKEWKKYCLNEIDDELYKSNFCPISNHFSQVRSFRPLKIGLEDTCATTHLRNEILGILRKRPFFESISLRKCHVAQIFFLRKFHFAQVSKKLCCFS